MPLGRPLAYRCNFLNAALQAIQGTEEEQLGIGANGGLGNGLALSLGGVTQTTTIVPMHGQHYGHRPAREYTFKVTANIPAQYQRLEFQLARR
jgi:hypothetical protein